MFHTLLCSAEWSEKILIFSKSMNYMNTNDHNAHEMIGMHTACCHFMLRVSYYLSFHVIIFMLIAIVIIYHLMCDFVVANY